MRELLRDSMPEIIGGLVVAAVLTLIGALYTGLGIWAIIVITAGGVWLGCAYLAFKRNPPLVEDGTGTWQYPRWRRWALAGLVIIPLLTASGVGYYLYQQAQPPGIVTSPTEPPVPPTRTPMAIFTPTNTPVPSSPIAGIQTLGERRINSVAVDPTNSKVLYAAVQDEGVYNSVDGGASWGLILDNPSSAHIAMDPTNSQVLYVGVWKGVCKTTNGGASWQLLQEGLTAEAAIQQEGVTIESAIQKVVVAPTNPQRLFAVNESWFYGKAYESDDGGASWHTLETGFPQDYNLGDVADLAVDPSNDDVIYVGGRIGAVGEKILEGGVLKTTDGGKSWSFIGMTDELKIKYEGEVHNPSVWAFAIHPTSPQIVYVTLTRSFWGSEVWLFKSTNGGVSWEYVVDLSEDPWLQADWTLRIQGRHNLFVHPLNPQTIFVGNGRVLRSTDGGVRWEEVLTNDFLRRGGEPYEKWLGQEFLYFASDFAFDHNDRQVIYASTWRGLLKSTDGGKTWDWM